MVQTVGFIPGGGGSLVPDIRGLTGPLSQALDFRRAEAKQEQNFRRAEAEQEQNQASLEEQIRIATGRAPIGAGIEQQPGIPGQTSQSDVEAASIRIAQLGGVPLANFVREIAERGDRVELEQSQRLVEQRAKDAIFLQRIKDPIKRQQEITKIAQRQIASPDEDPEGTMKLSNASPAEQDNIIQRQILEATDIKTVLADAQKGLERQILKDVAGRQRFVDTGELTFPEATGTAATTGSFSKAPGVIIERPGGGFAQAIPVLNERTGQIENRIVPIGGQPVSRLGETPEQIRQRAIETVGGTTAVKLKKELQLKPQIEAAVAEARIKAADRGQTFTELNQMQAALPGLRTAVDSLRELALIATSTFGGKVFDLATKESGFGATKGSTARAKFQAIVDNQVLPLLKPTFGGAFSVQEGESLRATLGDINALPQEKLVQLDAFIDQKVRDIETKEAQLQDVNQPVLPSGRFKIKVK